MSKIYIYGNQVSPGEDWSEEGEQCQGNTRDSKSPIYPPVHCLFATSLFAPPPHPSYMQSLTEAMSLSLSERILPTLLNLGEGVKLGLGNENGGGLDGTLR